MLSVLVAVGCGSSSPPPNDGGGGGAGGAGGSATDAGTDGIDGPVDATIARDAVDAVDRANAADAVDATAVDATDGTGAADAAIDRGTDGSAADSGTDARDGASDGASDGSSDGSSDGPTICSTTFGAGNPVQFAFNGGANVGWIQFIGHDEAMTGLTSSLGASFTDGHSCPGALVFAVNFTAYGPSTLHNESGSTEYFYAVSPNGRNWSAYKAIHAWIKVQTADVAGLDGVYFYVKSANNTKYQSAFGASADLGDWRELVIDLTTPGAGFIGVVATDIQLIGFEVALRVAPPPGAPPTPSQAILTVDDIWLEALPPGDAGAGQ